MKKQRKGTRLKRKRLKAAHNTILEENRRLKGWQSVMAEKRLEHLENAKYSQYLKQEVTIWEKS